MSETQSYNEKVNARIKAIGSRLCVGLDPRIERIDGSVKDFLIKVIEQTSPHAAAFKPNIAYFEAMGLEGYQILDELIRHVIPKDVPIILDAKRGDIGATQEHYVKAYFENWDVDAVTLSPYMGFDSIEPFLNTAGKAVYLLAVTSNKGASDLQFLETSDGRKLFQHVFDMAERAKDLPGTVGFVMGLTNLSPELLASVPDSPLLIPGLGAQGGQLDGLNADSKTAPMLFNSSRGILFGADGDFASRAIATKEKINHAI
ncbi:MAG: orotidine-5'-phosphate decarboxylase [Planctomycetota bacterium]|nr:orotidine-5'-phosphate decarboxylase [Planctomycetota bacterium]